MAREEKIGIQAKGKEDKGDKRREMKMGRLTEKTGK